MKTAREFCAEQGWIECEATIRAIGCRDAEHIAESKAREEALQATIERIGKEATEAVDELRGEYEQMLATLSNERDRLKGELAEARRLIELGIANSGLWPELRAKYRAFLAAPSPAESTGVHECTRPKCAGWKQMEPDEREGLDEKTFCDLYEASEIGRSCPRGQCVEDPKWHRECRRPAVPPDDIRERLEHHEKANAAWELKIERRLEALEAIAAFRSAWNRALAKTAEPPAAPQEQAGRCRRMVDDNRQCTARVGHEGGCHHMQVEVPVWVVPTKPHRFAPQRRHRGIPINLCDECAHEESHPIHTGAKP